MAQPPATPTEPLPKTLFVSHDAHRHGAQLLVLNLLRWVRENTELPFEIVCKNGGVLVEEFRQLAPTLVASEDAPSLAKLQTRLSKGEFAVVYANTMACGDLLAQLQPRCPVISHIHELEMMIRHHVGYAIFEQTRKWSKQFVACSRAVLNNLVANHSIPEDQIELIHEFVPYDPARVYTVKQGAKQLRTQFGIPEKAFVVGGSGTTDWRKGPDIFVQVAKAFAERYAARPVHFLWIGGANSGPERDHLEYEIRQAGLSSMVRFAGTVSNPLEHFAMFNALALTSREDPFPLVVLEAATLGIPTVCFREGGGIAEFVEPDCGFAVPYASVSEMADRLQRMAQSEIVRIALGQRAFLRVRNHHTVAATGPRVVSLIQRVARPAANRTAA